jgi:hypothetical protein
VIAGTEIPELLEVMDPASIRVHSPTSAIFLCGGPVDVKAAKPVSLRDAYLRVSIQSPLVKYSVRLAEEINPYFPRGRYKDLLRFESDIAQIFDLVLLFSESFGSASELGAFASIPEIAQRLLVVVDDKNYGDESFVRLGPLLSLENDFGDSAVCVLNRADVGMVDIRRPEDVDLPRFHTLMSAAITARLGSARDPATLDTSRQGHVIKLITGLIQHYGALTLDEVIQSLECLSIAATDDQVTNYLLCAEFVGWVKKDKRGLKTYFAHAEGSAAINYKYKGDPPVKDKSRWRADILEYWRSNDPNRLSSISAARSGSS